MMTETEKAWAAGFIDGEGSFFISPRHRNTLLQFSAGLVVANTHAPSVIRLQELSSMGSVYHLGSRKARKSALPMYTWNLRRRNEVEFLLGELLPYFVTKKEQAQKVLEFLHALEAANSRRRTTRARNLTQQDKQGFMALSQKLSQIKHRPYSISDDVMSRVNARKRRERRNQWR